MPLGQWSGHIWATELDLVPSRSPTPQIPWRPCIPSTPPSRLDTRSPAIPSRNGFPSRCSTRCTTRASSRLSNRGRGKFNPIRSAKTPSLETPRSVRSPRSPSPNASDEDAQLVKQAHTIRKWSTNQVDIYAQNTFSSLIEDDEPLLEPDSVQDQQMLILYQASLELTEAGISTVMAPTVARRFKTALDQIQNCTCEMEILIDAVLKVLDDNSDHGFEITTGKMIGVGLAADEDEQKTKLIMDRVFGLLAALSAEAKSFNFMAWLQAMGESDMEVTELVEEFIQQKQEIRKLLWISNIEADEFLTSRLLVAAMTFAKWFDKMRKAADEFQELLLKQYAEDGHYGYYKLKQTFQEQAEERKRWAIRLQEKKEYCKREAHEKHMAQYCMKCLS